LDLADINAGEFSDLHKSLVATPQLIDHRLQPAEVTGPLLLSVGADDLSGLVEALTFPGINSTNSVHNCSDRLGVNRIGSVPAGPILVLLALRLTRSISSP